MKIKLFIVTYNENNALNTCLNSLETSDFWKDHNQEIYIINNHSNFHLEEKFKNVKVIHNAGRPDFSTGHLSRNWNQALLHGFKNLNNPDCDLLVTLQNDALVRNNFLTQLLQAHKTYNFITNGWGDEIISYTPEAVRNIGIWDERFCNVGYQEADYFLRATLYNPTKSSINDWQIHYRNWNSINIKLTDRYYKGHNLSSDRMKTLQAHKASLHVFKQKWGTTNATFPSKVNIKTPLIETFVTYPYFEKDILNLQEKGYKISISDMDASFPEFLHLIKK